MIDSQIHVAIKSYKRPDSVTTIKAFPFAYIWVPESQAADYEANYPGRIISIPDDLDGNLCRKQNAILDRAPTETGCPWILILDDDITRMCYYESGEHIPMDPTHMRAFVEHHFCLADQLGVKMWGVQQNQDPLGHYTYRPFSLLSPILGPFHGHLDHDLRFDEYLDLKEDYDFWLRMIIRHRFTLRANKYHYHHRHAQGTGGQVSMRTMKRELDAIDRLIARYGPKVIRPGGSAGGKGAKGNNILNTFVRINIPGT